MGFRMTKRFLTSSALSFCLGLGLLTSGAQAAERWTAGWLPLENGALVHEDAGVYCPESFESYTRDAAEAEANSGYCAYEDAGTGSEFSVQFYESHAQSVEAEIRRTQAHFEDRGAMVSLANSVGCEGQMTASRHPGSYIEDLADTSIDYEIDDGLRCLVMQGSDAETVFIVSMQEVDGWIVSVVTSTNTFNEARINSLVTAASDFQAMQFARPSV